MAFESAVLQGMDLGERANVITQFAILLLKASGVQGSNDDEL
jgi:hypothetical protein